MAIFLKAYKGYEGTLTSSFERVLVIFRYGLADALESRLFVAYLFSCMLLPVGVICFLYFYNNLELLLTLDINFDAMPIVDGEFFAVVMQLPHHLLLFFMVVVVGPIMISPDLRNNAMPLYLSRPISKSSYILGKLLVMIFLGSVISWIPTWFVFGLQSFLAGPDWMLDNLQVPVAALFTSMTWIVCMSLIALTVSTFVKWKAVARIAFFGVFFIASIVGGIIEELFGGIGGYLINISASSQVLIATLYDATDNTFLDFVDEMSVQLALAQMFAFTCAAAIILYRKIRAYQVVS